MRILFIRHGKAEPYSFNVEDANRKLTQEGHQLLEENMPYLREYFKGKKLIVYSSPLIRAIETAQYLLQDIIELDALASGNLEEIKEVIKQNSELDFLVFVGHQPILSNWIYDLSSEFIEVKKGMAVELDESFNVIRALKIKNYNEFIDL